MYNSVVHSGQFLLGPHPLEPNSDWRQLRLGNGLVLSFCPKLPLVQVTDRKGRSWLLLGHAVEVEPARPAPAEALRGVDGEDVSRVYEGWAGRWLLIGDGKIHSDAGGLLGCFFGSLPDASGRRQLWVSSSLSLLVDYASLERPSGRPRRLLLGDGFEWDPPPGTGYEGIRKLLPSQALDLSTGRIEPRPLRIGRGRSYEQVLDELAACLVTAFRKLEGSIWLALTAGYDSRVLLAAAHAAGTPVRTYTQTYPNMLGADYALPPLLSRSVGFDHRMIEPKREDPALLRAFDAHCGGQNVDADRSFYAGGQWSWTKSRDVLVRGLGFEVGHCFYWDRLPAETPSLCELLRCFGAGQSPGYVRQSMAEYLDWIGQTPVEGIDWRDRFYLDVRLGGWASAEEQSLDLVEGTRFIPANSARIYELLLLVPPEKRLARRHHIDLIERLSPELLGYPFNAADGFLRTNRRRVAKYAKLLRERGIGTAVHQVETAIRHRLRQRADPKRSSRPAWPYA